MIGGLVFVVSCSDVLGPAVAISAKVLAVVGALAVLWFFYVRPCALGRFGNPKWWGIAIYLACVVGEIALIRFGTVQLEATDRLALQLAPIGAVVGLHFIPLALAFGQRLLYVLGGALLAPGVLGLVFGNGFGATWASVAAVLSGLVMIALIVAYARGAFAGDAFNRAPP